MSGCKVELPKSISIHSLRVEGDAYHFTVFDDNSSISIHSLRVEGDWIPCSPFNEAIISIHSLRVEGD